MSFDKKKATAGGILPEFSKFDCLPGRAGGSPDWTRWKIEETFRFVKQSYNLEDIRVLKYQRLKNLVVLVTAAAYFAATFLGQQMKLRILTEKLLVISQ